MVGSVQGTRGPWGLTNFSGRQPLLEEVGWISPGNEANAEEFPEFCSCRKKNIAFRIWKRAILSFQGILIFPITAVSRSPYNYIEQWSRRELLVGKITSPVSLTKDVNQPEVLISLSHIQNIDGRQFFPFLLRISFSALSEKRSVLWRGGSTI